MMLLFSAVNSNAQNSNVFSAPKGYQKVLETKGDLDKDGKPEVVLVYNIPKVGETDLVRIMYICKQENGKLKLWKSNTSILRSSRDCGFCVDEGVNLSVRIKNNTLITEQSFNHNSRHYSTWKNIFRFQNNDWFLIGSTYRDYDTCDFDYQYDINFSTKKVAVAYTYGDCDETPRADIPEDSYIDFSYPFKGTSKWKVLRPEKWS